MIGNLTDRIRAGRGHPQAANNGAADMGTGSDPGKAERVSLKSMGLRGTISFGLALVGVFFGVFGVWAAWADLETAAIAQGQVVVGSNRKVVQHLEGGIVRDIRVVEGSKVEAGAPLIELEETQPESTLGMVQVRLRNSVAREARLTAERDGLAKVDFPDWLEAKAANDAGTAEILDAQRRIFVSRREAIESQTKILEQRIAQYREEISGLEAEIASETKQLGLISDELKDVQYLVDKGLERLSRLRGLQRQAAEIQGSRARNRALIARAKQSIGETDLRIIDLSTTLNREVNEEMREVQADVADLEERHRAAKDVMTRTVIRAPVSGTVVNLKVFTIGGVIAPREPLMEIVPLGDELIVEARVDPSNIDSVHAGLRANVRFTAFTARNIEMIEGHVEQVSADALVDQRTGMTYYSARIVFNEDERARLGNHDLYPGMPAEVMIIAGERTALSYLVEPLVTSFGRAMRED